MKTRAEAFAEFWECDRILGMVDKSNAAYIFAMGYMAAEREATFRKFEKLFPSLEQTQRMVADEERAEIARRNASVDHDYTAFAESIGLAGLTPEQRNAVLDDWRNKP